MSEKKEFLRQTVAGWLRISPHSADYIFTEFKDNAVFNTVEYSCNIRMHRWNDGKWHVGEQFNENGTTINEWTRINQAVYMNKRHSKSYNDSYPSESAKRKAIELVTDVVNRWAEVNLTAIAEAELDTRQDAYEQVYHELEEARKQVKALEAKVADALDRLAVQKKVVDTMALPSAS